MAARRSKTTVPRTEELPVRTRKKLFNALAALAVAVPAAILAVPPSAEATGPNLLPLTVTNNTGRGEAVYLYVLGTNLSTGKLGYVNSGGAFNAWPAGALPPSAAPDVAIGGPGNGASTTVQLPRGISGRIYMSFGEKLKLFLTPDGFVQPSMDNPSDPNHNILFDWSEFTYNNDGLWINSTQVDMFAVPHVVSVTGANGATTRTGEVVNNGRNNVIDQIKAQSGWANTVVTRSDGTVLRVLAPGHAAAAGLFSTTYLDSYINSAWSAYAGKTLTVVPFAAEPNTKFFGRTSGNVMNFTNTSGAQVASFTKPSSANVWGCDGNLFAPNDRVVGPIARTLCAALHRGTLGTMDTQPGGSAADFYKISPTDQYSRIIHANMADGKAYGFSFDDVMNQESLVSNNDPRSASITLSPFGGGGPSGTNSIVSDWNGRCVDVPNATFNDGQRLQMYECNNSAAQKWSFTNGTVRTQNNLCMDVAWGSVDNGAAIQIANCSGNPAQQFVMSSAGDLVNPQANKCVDIKDWNPDNGALLQLWECGGTANQKWHRA
jgi:hypothetical protein